MLDNPAINQGNWFL